MAERKYSVPPCVRYLVYWYWYTGIPLYVHTCILYTGTYMNGTHFICAHVLYARTYARIARVYYALYALSLWIYSRYMTYIHATCT